MIVGGESGNTSYLREKDENGDDKFEIINEKVVFINKLDENGNKIIEKTIRPMKKEWVDKIKNKCLKQNVPFFFKQWGKLKNNPNQNDPTTNKEHRYYAKGGCMLDGKLYQANPTVESDLTPTIKAFEDEYYVMDEYEGLNTIWELKSYLPLMQNDLFEQLKENIRKNGLNDPILYFTTNEGKKLVIEGHTRLKACIELNFKNIPTKEIKEEFQSIDDIKLWMVRHQFQRRNLSSIEKIQLAYLSKDSIEKIAKGNLSKGGKKIKVAENIDTNSEIARLAGVSRTTIVNYNTILNKASKNIIKDLNSGKISISTAYEKVKNLSDKKPSKIQKPKKEIAIKLFDFLDEGMKQVENNSIKGLIVIKDEENMKTLSDTQKTHFGFYITK